MRRLLLIPAMATILALGAPMAALAATATPEAANPAPAPTGNLVIDIVQTLANGSVIDAVATVTDVSVVNGVLTATGTITGTLTSVAGTVTEFTSNFTAPLSVVSATCDILTLNVGAIHLDLLGLVVDTSPIDVLISAVAAPGNLLGNLLCAVAHLLDGNASLSAIAALLDHIIAIL
jgi:hypothetical protein